MRKEREEKKEEEFCQGHPAGPGRELTCPLCRDIFLLELQL